METNTGIIAAAPLDGAHGHPLAARFQDLPTQVEIERRYLLHVLDAVAGNRTRAAQVLGIDRRTLYRIAENYGLRLKDENQGRFRSL